MTKQDDEKLKGIILICKSLCIANKRHLAQNAKMEKAWDDPNIVAVIEDHGLST